MSKLLLELQAKARRLIDESSALTAKGVLTADEVVRLGEIVAELEETKPQIAAAKSASDLAAWGAQAGEMIPLSDPTKSADPSAAQGDDDATANIDAPAIRHWYVKRYGDTAKGAEQIAKELYRSAAPNGSFEQLTWEKHRDFNRYLRTGIMDPKMARVMLLSPEQIVNAAAHGLTVSEIRATMIEGDDELGGYLVPEDFRTDMVERLPGETVVRKHATVETTSRDIVTRPRRTGGDGRYIGAVRVTWVDETPTGTEAATNSTFGQISVPVHTLMAHTEISKNQLEDSIYDPSGFLMPEFTSAVAIDEDEQFLTGNGVGRPEGILNGTSANGAPFNADITVVNSGLAAALSGDGVKAVPFGLAKQYRSNQATWIMAKATLQTIATLKDGNGQYLVGGRDQADAVAVPDKLLRFMIEESEAMPAIAANTYPIIFGDLRGYLIVDRVGMSIQRYDDSTTAKSNTVVYVLRRRVGGRVTQGWRLAAQKVAA